MFKFLTSLKSDKSSTAHRQALAEATNARDDATRSLESLKRRLPSALIDSSPEEVTEINADMDRLAREVEQLDGVIKELGPRITAAADREARAELDQLHAAALAAQRKGLACLERYDELAPQIGDALKDLIEANETIRQFHRRAKELRDDRRIELPQLVRVAASGRSVWSDLPAEVVLPAAAGGPPIWNRSSR